MSLRNSLSFVLLSAALSLTACGGGDEEQPTPEGTKYTFVVDSVTVPTAATLKSVSLDLDGDKKTDNQLGQVLGLLKQNMVDVQPSLTAAIQDGSIVLLAEFQTKDFAKASASGLKIFLGDKLTIMPPPCTDPAMPATCGKHLAGTGMFTISANSPRDALVSGPIVNGTFKGGPGKVSLQISLAEGQAPLQLDLLGARAQATGITENGIMSGIIGGAISKSDLDTKVLPAIQGQLAGLVTMTCPGPKDMNGNDSCGCPANATGKTVLSFFDSAPKDCMISLAEIQDNNLIKGTLSPDVNIDGTPALSLGIGMTAKKGAFTP